jgi:hypothetical protein
MIVILLPIMIKVSIFAGRTNIYDRINDYNISFNKWNQLVSDNIIPYDIYVFENSGYGNVFNLHPKIKYISLNIQSNDRSKKGRSLSLVIKTFIDMINLNENDKLFVMTGRYAPISPLNEIFNILENNNCIISGLPGDHGGLYNSMWFGSTIKILKEFLEYCISNCHEEAFTNFETALSNTFNKHQVYIYTKGIKIVPTFEGGYNRFIYYI